MATNQVCVFAGLLISLVTILLLGYFHSVDFIASQVKVLGSDLGYSHSVESRQILDKLDFSASQVKVLDSDSVSTKTREAVKDSHMCGEVKKTPLSKEFFDDMSIDAASPVRLLVRDSETSNSDGFAMQQRIWHLQHPQNCETSRLLILSDYHRAGVGSTLHLRACQFMLGLDHDRVVVDDPNVFWDHTSKGKEHCPSTGFNCFFLPLSNCTVPSNFREQGAVRSNSVDAISSSTKWVYADSMAIFFEQYSFEHLMPRKFGQHLNKSSHWWMSQLIRYIVRPNRLTVHSIIMPAFYSVFIDGIPDNLASVFIRWGDKGKEHRLEGVEAHLRPILAHKLCHVFIGSDSQKAIDEAISRYGRRLRLYTLNVSRAHDGMVWDKFVEKVGTSGIVEQMKRNLMQLFLSVQGDIMAGELGSNWCRLEHELHDALGKFSFPYYPIGECGPGHHVTWCHGD